MRIKIVLLFLIICSLLNGCGKQEKKQEYLDIEQEQKKMQQNKLDAQIDNMDEDDKAYNTMSDGFTTDGQYLYGLDKKKLNLKNGRMQYLCSIPGCQHDINVSPDCLSVKKMYSAVYTKKGIFCLQSGTSTLKQGSADAGKLWKYLDGKISLVYENTFYTDYEEKNYPDAKNSINFLLAWKNKVFLVGGTFYREYDLDTKTISDAIVISDTGIMGMCVTDKYIYYYNNIYELYRYDKKTKEKNKIADKVAYVTYQNQKIYYVCYEDEIPFLYDMKEDGTEKRKLIKDCWVNCSITDKAIYYQAYCSDYETYVSDLNGENVKQIIIKNKDESGQEERIKEFFYIIAYDKIKDVFFVDENFDNIYALEKETLNYKVINENGD